MLVETFGKVGAVGRHYDAERAAALRAARLEASRERSPSSHGHGEKEIPLSKLSTLSPSAASSMHPAASERRASSAHLVRRMFDKDYAVRAPTSRDSWHEWEDLTEEEIGEEDVGVEVSADRRLAAAMQSQLTLPFCSRRWAPSRPSMSAPGSAGRMPRHEPCVLCSSYSPLSHSVTFIPYL